jgi:hypothetical protein
MSPSAARASVIALSFVVLGLSALATAGLWEVLSPLALLPRALISLLAWTLAYYAGANLVFWRGVARISPSPAPEKA